ncbi:hypothetical protein [Spirosoma endophyticum]|uniref:hypothetical protein n=1 Tax=Spirosoma endophyticum TaxID=662367 RepID=UPI0015A5127F|nr:hypothetical protein [Spirosoma endophyticum]
MLKCAAGCTVPFQDVFWFGSTTAITSAHSKTGSGSARLPYEAASDQPVDFTNFHFLYDETTFTSMPADAGRQRTRSAHVAHWW